MIYVLMEWLEERDVEAHCELIFASTSKEKVLAKKQECDDEVKRIQGFKDQYKQRCDEWLAANPKPEYPPYSTGPWVERRASYDTWHSAYAIFVFRGGATAIEKENDLPPGCILAAPYGYSIKEVESD